MAGQSNHSPSNSSNKDTSTSYLRERLIETREYQVDIARQCIGKNSLVVLPTGLGKTLIAVIVAAKTLDLYPVDSKVIVLAPTRPLINQHYDSFRKFLTIPEEQFDVLTGKTPPEKRITSFNTHRLLFYTPQTLRNDLVSRRYDLKNACLIVFDEAHHSSGDYPYPLIADTYAEQNFDGNILALTASPGASKEKIAELCKTLHVEKANIHTRTRTDGDVKEYLKPLDVYKIGVELTDLMANVYVVVQQLLEERLQYLSQFGFLESKGEKLFNTIIRKDLLRLNGELVSLLKSNGDKTGVYTALSINAQALILFHVMELVEQQGLDVLFIYLKKLKEDGRKPSSSKAVKVLASDYRLNQVLIELLKQTDLSPEQLVHPKYKVLESVLEEEFTHNPEARILVFVKLRDSVKNIVSKLKATKNPLFKPSRFVGQASKSKEDKGLSQKKQLEILERFKQGDLNVLVSTNVGEEGLDIAECDLVIFYDVVASEIRFIQRRGRTARHREGKVIILYCKNTHDEVYMQIALSKLKRMNVHLKNRSQLSTYHAVSREEVSEAPANFTPPRDAKLSEDSNPSKPGRPPGKGINRIDYFLGASHEPPHARPHEITLSTRLNPKFGLRKKLQQDNIATKIAESEISIKILDTAIIQIADPRGLHRDARGRDVLASVPLDPKIKVKTIILDFIDYVEEYPGEERELRSWALQCGKASTIQVVNIDNAEELYFIVKNIYDHTKKEGG